MKYKYIGYEKRKRAYMKILKILFLIKTILRLIISLNAITKLNWKKEEKRKKDDIFLTQFLIAMLTKR